MGRGNSFSGDLKELNIMNFEWKRCRTFLFNWEWQGSFCVENVNFWKYVDVGIV